MAEPKCEACGLLGGTAEYANVRVRTVNGGLSLCRQCLAEINGRNPEVARLRAELAAALADRDRMATACARWLSPCERCGGAGVQAEGYYNADTRRYDDPPGVCRGCGGAGYLGVSPGVIMDETRKAVAAERDRCARVVEADPNGCPHCNAAGHPPDFRARDIAAKIREGTPG